MTDNEIIKALECYLKENEFEYFHSNTMNEYPLVRQALNLINRQKAEIERWEISHSQFISDINAYKEKLKTAKAEAVKEFAERLDESLCKNIGPSRNLYWKISADIDNLVKEMVGEG